MMTLVKCPVKCHPGTCWLPAGHDTIGGTGFRWCVSPRSLYCNVTSFPFPLSVRRVTKPFPHSDGVGENIFLPEVGRVSAILGNSSVRMILFLLSHLFLYSVIYQHVLMEIYFILWVPNQCLFCCSDCSRSGLWWERFQVGCCVFWTCQLFFLALPYFSALKGIPGLSCIFPMSVLESSHFSTESCFIFLEKGWVYLMLLMCHCF